MTTPDPVCRLDPKALEERLAMIRREILPRVAQRERRPDGLLLEFAADGAFRARLEEWVALERECCADLSWKIEQGEPPRLVIGGVAPDSGLFEVLDPAASAPRGRLARLAKAGGLGAAVSFVLFCIVPIGVAALVGSAAAAPLLALDDPRVIGLGAVALAVPAWWLVRRRERARARTRACC